MLRNSIAYKAVLSACAFLYAAACQAGYDTLILQQPKNQIARDVYDLHTTIMWICVVIFIVVFGAMFYSILNHRRSVGHKAAHFHENTTIEVVWTVIPFLILIFMAFPATKTVLAMKDTSNPDLTLKVTAYQWKWEYDYMKEGVKYFSTLSTPREQIGAPGLPGTAKGEHYLLEVDNPMVIPTGKKVRLLITSNDVIHGFYVPSLSVHQYGIPGFIKDTWIQADEPGTYRGQCSQICGKEHGYMPIVVVAKAPAEFDAWVKEQKAKSAAADAPAATAAAAPAPAAAAPAPAAAPAADAPAPAAAPAAAPTPAAPAEEKPKS
jgi:cytochrome c oxidase subunit II